MKQLLTIWRDENSSIMLEQDSGDQSSLISLTRPQALKLAYRLMSLVRDQGKSEMEFISQNPTFEKSKWNRKTQS